MMKTAIFNNTFGLSGIVTIRALAIPYNFIDFKFVLFFIVEVSSTTVQRTALACYATCDIPSQSETVGFCSYEFSGRFSTPRTFWVFFSPTCIGRSTCKLATSVLTLSTGFHKNLSHPPSSEWFLKHGGAEACVRIVKQNVDTVEGLSSWDKDTLNAVQNAFVNGDVWLRRLVEIGALAQLDTFIEARSDYLAPCFTAINVSSMWSTLKPTTTKPSPYRRISNL
eukprot:116176_1